MRYNAQNEVNVGNEIAEGMILPFKRHIFQF